MAYTTLVTYKRSRLVQGSAKIAIDSNLACDFEIKKKYRFNPLTNGDTPWAIRDYFREHLSDPRNKNPNDILNAKICAIQECLHKQTNYNELLSKGLYDLARDKFAEVVIPWYTMIAKRFPDFKQAAEFEMRRHINNHRLGLI